MEEVCVGKALEANHDCLMKCDGLYADVWYSEEDNKIPDQINGGDAALLQMLKEGEEKALPQPKRHNQSPLSTSFTILTSLITR